MAVYYCRHSPCLANIGSESVIGIGITLDQLSNYKVTIKSTSFGNICDDIVYGVLHICCLDESDILFVSLAPVFVLYYSTNSCADWETPCAIANRAA